MMSALQRIMLIFKAGNKPRRQIELKLKQKGVDADIISRVCDEFYEDNSDIELEQAKAFVEKKHIDIENADYKKSFRRSKLHYIAKDSVWILLIKHWILRGFSLT